MIFRVNFFLQPLNLSFACRRLTAKITDFRLEGLNGVGIRTRLGMLLVAHVQERGLQGHRFPLKVVAFSL